MKYADIELLTKEINSLYDKWCGSSTGLEVAEEGASIDTAESIFKEVRKIIGSLQQEPTPDTDVLHTELVNLLKTYRIGEETARTMADRIADTYGAQKYMDGLCDGLDEEDTKQEQEKFREKLIEWAKENMDSLGRLSYGEFIDKLNSM